MALTPDRSDANALAVSRDCLTDSSAAFALAVDAVTNALAPPPPPAGCVTASATGKTRRVAAGPACARPSACGVDSSASSMSASVTMLRHALRPPPLGLSRESMAAVAVRLTGTLGHV
eukprot:70344-Chlamydomonas_euryale.AAC.1